ncbi:MAG: sugar phosphate isomerase/epimerase [Pirellulaceae bacterium]|nr:sugar phosphate isomerase/epimerase [Pirellulaceae bacterium]
MDHKPANHGYLIRFLDKAPVYLGYNTNGLANHHSLQAIELIAELGYDGIAITVDHGWLNPFDPQFDARLREFESALQLYRLKTVVETGARFLLNPNVKHEPTLISEGSENRFQRIEYLKRCIDVAASLGSDCVSLWSGKKPDTINLQTAMDRLAESLDPVIQYAETNDVIIGFEPEPGMLIDTMNAYERLLQWIDSPAFQLTLDIGHLFCQGEVPIVDFILRWKDRIVNVHIEDMKAGDHEHLMFGDGHIHFPPIFAALQDIDYQGGVFVELSRHSYNAPVFAKQSIDFLAQFFPQEKSNPKNRSPFRTDHNSGEGLL